MMHFGIPAYRLPRAVLDAEVARLGGMGVVFELNHRVENLEAEWKDGGFAAVFLAVGAHLSKRAGIPARDAGRMLDAVSFLRDVEAGTPPKLGRRVAVYGGGNTAMDAARTALRLGHEPLIIYRRDREHMPAHDFEAAEALEEGVKIHWLRAIKGLEGGALKVEVMALDADGAPHRHWRRSRPSRPTTSSSRWARTPTPASCAAWTASSSRRRHRGGGRRHDDRPPGPLRRRRHGAGRSAASPTRWVTARRPRATSTPTCATPASTRPRRRPLPPSTSCTCGSTPAWPTGRRRTRPSDERRATFGEVVGGLVRARGAPRGLALPVVRHLLRVRRLLRGLSRGRGHQARSRPALRVRLRPLHGLRDLLRAVPVPRHLDGARAGRALRPFDARSPLPLRIPGPPWPRSTATKPAPASPIA